jgi:hypothetical protein
MYLKLHVAFFIKTQIFLKLNIYIFFQHLVRREISDEKKILASSMVDFGDFVNSIIVNSFSKKKKKL